MVASLSKEITSRTDMQARLNSLKTEHDKCPDLQRDLDAAKAAHAR